MKNYIDNIDFHNLAAMKYWAPPASWNDAKKRSTTRERIYSGEWLGARKMDGSFWKFPEHRRALGRHDWIRRWQYGATRPQ